LKALPYLPGKEWGSRRWILVAWVVIPVVVTLLKFSLGPTAYNNYLIYRQVFWHVLDLKALYDFYPAEYLYQNHYGPTFSLVIAPFAILPDALGMVLWGLANALLLGYAILRLPMADKARFTVMAIVLVEMTGAVQNQQFNPMLTAWILLAFIWIGEGRLFPAALLISGGTLVKLYGIMGVLFTPFDGRYRRMALAMIAAMLLLVCLPMLFSGPDFIMTSYHDWYLRLLGKNSENIRTNLTDGMQDLSAMGMIRRISGWTSMSNAWVMVPGGLLMLAPLLRRDRHADPRFRLNYLSQILIGIVIFSTSSESPTYVIAVTGFAIWYAGLVVPDRWHVALLVLLVLLTILPPTDIFPRSIKKQWVNRYALKALPCVLAWLTITWGLLTGRPEKESEHVPASTPAGA
jgi:hypothetical protein